MSIRAFDIIVSAVRGSNRDRPSLPGLNRDEVEQVPIQAPKNEKIEAGSPQTGPARSGYLFKHLCGIFVANSGDLADFADSAGS
jgi:hypothetical protein